MKYVALVFVILIACAQTAEVKQSEQAAQPESTLKGVSLSPKSFSQEDFKEFFEKTDKLDIISWAGKPEEFSKPSGAPHVVAQLSKQYSYIPVIITSAENKQAIEEFAKEYKPRYLGIGNEIKEADIDKVNEINSAVKQASPETQTFTTFQLENLKGRHDGLFGGEVKEAEWKLLERVNTDFIAFTTYPGLIYENPEDIPSNYYSEIAEHTSKPVAFTEVGWFRAGPAGWESSAEEQAEFIRKFYELTTAVKPAFIIWSWLYDQNIQEPFNTMGLLSAEQEQSSSYTAWTQ